MRKGLRACAIACLAILALLAAGDPARAAQSSQPAPAMKADAAVDRVVAVVNGEYITLFELNEAFKPFLERFKDQPAAAQQGQMEALRRQVLDRMINDILLKQEVERLKITVSEAELNAAIDDVKRRSNLSDEDLNRRIKLEGMSRKDYEARMRDDITRQRLLALMVRRKVVVTPEEIESYYKGNRGKLERGGQVDLGVILLGPGVDPEKLHADVSAGKVSFEDAARTHSKGPGAAQGGAMGLIPLADLNPDWRAALQGVKPGGLSKPFKVGQFMAILKLKGQTQPGEAGAGEPSKVGDGVPPDAQQEITEILGKQKMEETFNEYMERLRSKSVIDVRL